MRTCFAVSAIKVPPMESIYLQNIAADALYDLMHCRTHAAVFLVKTQV